MTGDPVQFLPALAPLKSCYIEPFDKNLFCRRITRVITHVNFDKFSYEYDIALLKMVTKVDFQPNIIPICLPVSFKVINFASLTQSCMIDYVNRTTRTTTWWAGRVP